eukprot:5775016-Prorocentrum_lima.AAC.1
MNAKYAILGGQRNCLAKLGVCTILLLPVPSDSTHASPRVKTQSLINHNKIICQSLCGRNP